MDEQNSEWMKSDPCYNTEICEKWHVKLLEGFIINVRTARYNIMCCIDANEEEHKSYRDDGISGGGCPIPTNSTT